MLLLFAKSPDLSGLFLFWAIISSNIMDNVYDFFISDKKKSIL